MSIGAAAYGAERLIASCGVTAAVAPVVSVRDLGARGDGETNDTRAFQLASAAIVAAGGGTLRIPPGVYVIGRQVAATTAEAGFAYRAESVIDIRGCRRPVVIDGRGAVLRCAAGLRLGAFDARTGRPHQPRVMPFIDPTYRADIYYGALHFERNRSVRVTGVEVDGNIDAIALGGEYGDRGYQVSHDGLVAIANGEILVDGAYFHHHGRDGIM
ncbi:MAG TPA: glycosyl hydrolase family 28-related protein, partial [Solirubrobacteraceae bacterium]|nr:glycosyl hydrolase family 28-related protein [Solirubrobacteraceae bacterium]